MILNATHQFAFVEIPKNASSSIHTALRDLTGSIKARRGLDRHATAHETRAAYPESRDWFYFAVIREPSDRFGAMYRHDMSPKRSWGRSDAVMTAAEYIRALDRDIIPPDVIHRPQAAFVDPGVHLFPFEMLQDLPRWLSQCCGTPNWTVPHEHPGHQRPMKLTRAVELWIQDRYSPDYTLRDQMEW